MKIDMSQFAVGGALSGAMHGMSAFAKVMSQLSNEPLQPEVLELDFANVEVATASFLRECVLSVRNAVRNRGSNFYPVTVSANQSIIDDLSELAEHRKEVFVIADRDQRGELREFQLVGRLEAKQQTTLGLVKRLRRTDAADLMERYGSDEGLTTTTAWNNRLASLALQGLIAENRIGRLKKYHMIFDGVV
jgi:5S rRNA maturation endonuclease (ribonuclease M5)